MTDKFDKYASGLDSPCYDGVTVTPSDSVNLTTAARALFIGTGGNISIQTAAGNTLVFTGVLSGSILPWRATRVNATGTSATNIVAGW